MARALTVAERMARRRECRLESMARGKRLFAESSRLERLIWDIERAISREIRKPHPNTKWMGERLLWRDRLAEKFVSLSEDNRLWPEDHCIF